MKINKRTLFPFLVILFIFFGSFFAPNDPLEVNLPLRFANPSSKYLLGNDSMGRCVLSRILYGGKTTLFMVMTASIIVFTLGLLLGTLTSKVTMKKNVIVDSIINAVTAIPPIAYLIIFIASWGNGIKTTLIALVVSYILRFLRLVRTQINIEYDKAYCTCMISLGASKTRLVLVTKYIIRFSSLYLFVLCGYDFSNYWFFIYRNWTWRKCCRVGFYDFRSERFYIY